MANGIEPAEKQKANLTPEQLRKKIIYQVEFYFGDYNLPKDKFLLSKVKENEGWVDLDTLLTFNRLKVLTTDKAVISEALKASDHGIVEVSDDNLKIRRNPSKPLPAAYKEEFLDRTVFVKGFPKDTTLDQLIEFFQPYKSGCVKMRRFSFNRQFKGSVFVLMTTPEAAKKLCETKSLRFGEDSAEDLIIMMASEYAEKKKAERASNKKKKAADTKADDSGGEDGVKGDANDDELKDLARAEEMFQKMDKKPGVFLRLCGFPTDSDLTFQDIKTVFTDAGLKVGFVEFEKGQEEALVRFDSENAGKTAFDQLAKEGKISIKDITVEARVLEGDEEIAQYRKQATTKFQKFKDDRAMRKRGGLNRQQGYRGQGGRRGRGAKRKNADQRGGGERHQRVGEDEKRQEGEATGQPTANVEKNAEVGAGDASTGGASSKDEAEPQEKRAKLDAAAE